MANSATNVGVRDSWSLLAFARAHGKCKRAQLTNSETGEQFESLAFVDKDDNVTFVGFSSNLGVLSTAEIQSRKDELQVVELESGTFKLCNQGNGGWEDIDLQSSKNPL